MTHMGVSKTAPLQVAGRNSTWYRQMANKQHFTLKGSLLGMPTNFKRVSWYLTQFVLHRVHSVMCVPAHITNSITFKTQMNNYCCHYWSHFFDYWSHFFVSQFSTELFLKSFSGFDPNTSIIGLPRWPDAPLYVGLYSISIPCPTFWDNVPHLDWLHRPGIFLKSRFCEGKAF